VNATGPGSQQTDAKPTIVLVHGAFADASSWNGDRFPAAETY
jgi:pimeloyl-ACP methyl ester carboxylesterase